MPWRVWLALSVESSRRLALDGCLVAALLLFVGLAVGPHLLPYRTVTVLSGSMSPALPTGAVVVDLPEPVSALRAGQVVSFHAPVAGHPVVTHRVVSVRRLADGAVAVRTKGDANPAPDPWLARVDDPTVWTVRAVLPGLGTAVRALRTPVVRAGAGGVLPVLLLGWFLWGVWRPARARP